jgi:hypothetical protein
MSQSPTPVHVVNAGQLGNANLLYVMGSIMGVMSIVFGGLAVLLSFIPLIGLMSLLICVGGVFWGGFGYLILHFGGIAKRTLPKIGLILCAGAFVLCILINLLFVAAASVSGG